MKTIFICYFGLFCCSYVTAQNDCSPGRYRLLMRQIDTAVQLGQYDLAINKLQSAKTCQPDSEAVVNKRVIEVFQVVNHQRELALENEKKAKRNLAKANRLIYHLDFREEEAAWAFKNGKFAVINLNGDTLTDFRYESPEPFQNGIALTGIENEKVFINSKGQEVSTRFGTIIKVVNGSYIGMKSNGALVFLNNRGQHKFNIFSNMWIGINDYILTGTYNESIGLINSNGQLVIDTQYQNIVKIDNGIAICIKNNKYHYLDLEGRDLTGTGYEFASSFYNGLATVQINGKKTLINQSGKLIIPEKYDAYKFYYNDLICVQKDGKWGLINRNGLDLVAPIYDDIGQFNMGLSIVKRNEKWGLIDTIGREIISPKYLQLGALSNGLILADDGIKKQFIDQNGNVMLVVPDSYKARDFYNNRCVFEENGKYGIIDRNGAIILAPKYEFISDFDKFGLAAFKENGYCGLIDTNASIIVPPRYSSISNYGDGFAIVGANNLYGLLSNKGLIIPIQYDEIKFVNDGLIIAKTGAKWEVVSSATNGSVFLDPYEYIGSPHDPVSTLKSDSYSPFWGLDRIQSLVTEGPADGLMAFGLNKRYGFINLTGSIVIPANYNGVGNFSEGLAKTNLGGFWDGREFKGGKWGFIDREQKVVVSFFFDEAGNFVNGLAKVNLGKHWSDSYIIGGKWGYINKKNQIVVDIIYDDAGDFSEHLARVNLGARCNPIGQLEGGKWGFINESGGLIVNLDYEFAGDFSGARARVNVGGSWINLNLVGGKWGFIGNKGQMLIEPQFEDAGDFSFGRAKVKKNGKWGFIDTLGNQIIPCQFDDALDFSGEEAVVKMNELFGVIDKDGQVLVPFEYENIGASYKGKRAANKGRSFVILDNNRIQSQMPGPLLVVSNNYKYLMAAQDLNNFGLIDISGNQILPFKYKITPVAINVFCLQQNDKYGLFAPDQDVFLEPRFSKIGFLGEEGGWIRVQQAGKWGWVDNKGNVKIPFKYDTASPFINGKALVRQEPYPEFYYINMKNEMLLIPPPK